jgi:hypothetical protein
MTNISQITHLNKSLPDTSGSVASNGMPFTCTKDRKNWKRRSVQQQCSVHGFIVTFSFRGSGSVSFFPRIRLPFDNKTVRHILPFIHAENISDLFTETYKMFWKLQNSNPCSSTFNTMTTDFSICYLHPRIASSRESKDPYQKVQTREHWLRETS